jgi:hypothetical protein
MQLRLSRIGECYYPREGRFPVRAIFIALHKKENRTLRSRLLGITPKAWKKLRNDKDLLARLRQDIGQDGKGAISETTTVALNQKGLYPEFLNSDPKNLFSLCLLNERKSAVFKSIFTDLREPTDRSLQIIEQATGKKLNINNLTLSQRRQLLELLKNEGIQFSQIERVIITDGDYFEVFDNLNGNLTIGFGRNCTTPATGHINWAPINLKTNAQL